MESNNNSFSSFADTSTINQYIQYIECYSAVGGMGVGEAAVMQSLVGDPHIVM